MKTAAFTGYRPSKLFGYNYVSKYAEMVDKLRDIIESLYEEGVRDYITGCAQGFDQLSFWAVNQVKKTHSDINNIVYVPFEHQHRFWLEDGLFGRKKYKEMLSLADEIVDISKVRKIDTGYKNGIIKALLERNKEMCNNSNIIIGSYEHQKDFLNNFIKGGTANCLRYAVKNTNIRILLLDPYTMKVKEYKR